MCVLQFLHSLVWNCANFPIKTVCTRVQINSCVVRAFSVKYIFDWLSFRSRLWFTWNYLTTHIIHTKHAAIYFILLSYSSIVRHVFWRMVLRFYSFPFWMTVIAIIPIPIAISIRCKHFNILPFLLIPVLFGCNVFVANGFFFLVFVSLCYGWCFTIVIA